jgi:aldehyde dehydrogenase (NAD+)
VAVATDSEFGLFIGGEVVESASGDVRARIKSGTVGINMPHTAFRGIPLGGYKQSGFGRKLALKTLDLHLETKSVIVSTGARPINPFGL